VTLLMFLTTLPPLPEGFGNPILRSDFHEIVPAAAINWWPQTLAWQILGVAVLYWFTTRCWRLIRQWRRNRYRREALQRLTTLGSNAPPAALNEVVKLAAMIAASRREVAGLSGEAWRHWLSQRTPEPVLSPATLAILTEAPYRGTANGPVADLAQVRREVVAWLKYHRDDHGPT